MSLECHEDRWRRVPQGPPTFDVLTLVYQEHRKDGFRSGFGGGIFGRSRRERMSAIADTLRKIAQRFPPSHTISSLEVVMARSNRKKIVPVNSVKVSVGREPAPVVWVGWQIRPGEKYFGIVQRADGIVERTRLERDDLQAAADFVTAHKLGKAASIRGRQVRRLP